MEPPLGGEVKAVFLPHLQGREARKQPSSLQITCQIRTYDHNVCINVQLNLEKYNFGCKKSIKYW